MYNDIYIAFIENCIVPYKTSENIL